MTFELSSLRANWNYPTSVRFGPGRIAELPKACDELGIRRPLLVTDPRLAGLPLVREAVRLNERAGLPTAVFSQIKANPVGANVEAGVDVFMNGAHDGVIALGGGSALDAGKAIALMVGQTRPLWDFEDVDDWWTRADEQGMAPVVAVPTTSGTGSEVGRASVIVDERQPKKKIIFHPRMLPGRVICDPELSIGLPAKVSAAVGMDALSHNLEAYCSPAFHPLAAGIALEGIRLVHLALRAAVADGSDRVARAQMMAASLMGATAFQRGLGAMHALAHPIGARFDTHHGTTIAVLMPHVLWLNREVLAEPLARLAAYLGLESPSAESVIRWVLALRQEIAIPTSLAELGVGEEARDELVQEALADPSGSTNPVPLTAPLLQRVFADAWAGAVPVTP